MIVKMIDLENSRAILDRIYSAKLPVRASFRVLRFAQNIGPVIEAFDKKKQEILQTYGVEQGGGRYIIPEGEQTGRAAWKELLETAEEINIPKLPPAALEGLNLSAVELLLIEWAVDFTALENGEGSQ